MSSLKVRPVAVMALAMTSYLVMSAIAYFIPRDVGLTPPVQDLSLCGDTERASAFEPDAVPELPNEHGKDKRMDLNTDPIFRASSIALSSARTGMDSSGGLFRDSENDGLFILTVNYEFDTVLTPEKIAIYFPAIGTWVLDDCTLARLSTRYGTSESPETVIARQRLVSTITRIDLPTDIAAKMEEAALAERITPLQPTPPPASIPATGREVVLARPHTGKWISLNLVEGSPITPRDYLTLTGHQSEDGELIETGNVCVEMAGQPALLATAEGRPTTKSVGLAHSSYSRLTADQDGYFNLKRCTTSEYIIRLEEVGR